MTEKNEERILVKTIQNPCGDICYREVQCDFCYQLNDDYGYSSTRAELVEHMAKAMCSYWFENGTCDKCSSKNNLSCKKYQKSMFRPLAESALDAILEGGK